MVKTAQPLVATTEALHLSRKTDPSWLSVHQVPVTGLWGNQDSCNEIGRKASAMNCFSWCSRKQARKMKADRPNPKSPRTPSAGSARTWEKGRIYQPRCFPKLSSHQACLRASAHGKPGGYVVREGGGSSPSGSTHPHVTSNAGGAGGKPGEGEAIGSPPHAR